MNFKKILIFAILGPWSILSAFQASAMRAQLSRYASTIIISSLPNPKTAETQMTQRWQPRVTICGYAAARKFKSNLPDEVFPLKPNTEQRSIEKREDKQATQLLNARKELAGYTVFTPLKIDNFFTLRAEDKQAAQLIDDLMHKKIKIHAFQEQFKSLKTMKNYYPQLYATIENYAHSPQAFQKLNATLTHYSVSNQLPAQSKIAFDGHAERIYKMPWWQQAALFCQLS